MRYRARVQPRQGLVAVRVLEGWVNQGPRRFGWGSWRGRVIKHLLPTDKHVSLLFQPQGDNVMDLVGWHNINLDLVLDLQCRGHLDSG